MSVIQFSNAARFGPNDQPLDMFKGPDTYDIPFTIVKLRGTRETEEVNCKLVMLKDTETPVMKSLCVGDATFDIDLDHLVNLMFAVFTETDNNIHKRRVEDAASHSSRSVKRRQEVTAFGAPPVSLYAIMSSLGGDIMTRMFNMIRIMKKLKSYDDLKSYVKELIEKIQNTGKDINTACKHNSRPWKLFESARYGFFGTKPRCEQVLGDANETQEEFFDFLIMLATIAGCLYLFKWLWTKAEPMKWTSAQMKRIMIKVKTWRDQNLPVVTDDGTPVDLHEAVDELIDEVDEREAAPFPAQSVTNQHVRHPAPLHRNEQPETGHPTYINNASGHNTSPAQRGKKTMSEKMAEAEMIEAEEAKREAKHQETLALIRRGVQ